MTTADWALVISIISAFVSFMGLAWNVWSKFIYPKPVLVVTFSVMNIYDEDGVSDPFFNLSITNHGPIATTVTGSYVRCSRGSFARRSLGFINPLSNFPSDFKSTRGPFSGGLPKKLDVGEEFSLKYWYGKNWMENRAVTVGVRDSFGRLHWCKRRDIREAKKHYEEDKAEGKLPVNEPR